MKRLLLVLTTAFLLFLALAEDGQTPFTAENRYYMQIQMSDTADTISERYGGGEKDGDYLLYGDVLCSFFESGRLKAKSLNYADVRDVAALTGTDFASIRGAKQGTHEDVFTNELGAGTELMRMNLSDEDDAGLRKLLAWKNPSGGVLEALFEQDDGEWILFAIGEIA